MINCKKVVFLFLLVIGINSNSRSQNLISPKDEFFTFLLPDNWETVQFIGKENYLASYQTKDRKVKLKIYKYIDTLEDRINLEDFTHKFKKSEKNLGYEYKTIEKSSTRIIKYFENNTNQQYKYALFVSEWHIMYLALFEYKNSNDEMQINRIEETFKVNVPFRKKTSTLGMKKLAFSIIGIILFIFLGTRVIKPAKNLLYLRKIEKKKGVKTLNKKFYTDRVKNQRGLLFFSLLLIVSLFVIHFFTPLNIFLALFFSFFGVLFDYFDPPDLFDSIENVQDNFSLADEATNISDIFN